MPGKAWSDPVPVLIVNPNSTESMTSAMLSSARKIAPDIEFQAWTSHDGPSAIQGREDGERATPPLLRLIDKAADARVSGLIIGCFDDTALMEARASVSFPVVGLGQAAYAYCALRGWRFSVVTTLPVSVPILEENVAAYGFGHFLGRVRASSVAVLELDALPDAASRRIADEANEAAAHDEVNAIVLGCAGMVAVTASLRARQSMPVVDPIEAAVGAIRWLLGGPASQEAPGVGP